MKNYETNPYTLKDSNSTVPWHYLITLGTNNFKNLIIIIFTLVKEEQ